MTDIVLTTWRRPDFNHRVINAISQNTLSPHRLIVIDNGSDRETVNRLKDYHGGGLIDILVLLNENRGLEYSRQLALSLVQTERFVTTDSDCLPHKPYAFVVGGSDWLESLHILMDSNSDYAAIACRTQVMIGTGNIFEQADQDGAELVEFTCGGSLRLMNTEVIRQLGGWDRHQELRGNEEHYICNKIRAAGFKCGFATHVPCYHLFGNGNWGYDPDLPPEQHGHRPIWHPALVGGDDLEILKDYI